MSAVSLSASTKSKVLSHSFTTKQITENRTITGCTQGVKTNKRFSVELEHKSWNKQANKDKKYSIPFPALLKLPLLNVDRQEYCQYLSWHCTNGKRKTTSIILNFNIISERVNINFTGHVQKLSYLKVFDLKLSQVDRQK